MRILVATNMYPTPENPWAGTFVQDQVRALREAGVSVDVFVADGPASRWNYVSGLFRLWRKLFSQRYDLIHAHYVLTGVLARAQWGHRVVLTHHGAELLGHPRWQSWLAQIVTPLFDEVIYVSEECRSAMADADGWVIPCGVDTKVFRPIARDEARRQLGLPLGAPLVLWAGNPHRPEKRFYMVEQAMAIVKEHLPDADLVLLAGKPHDVVPAHMSACDALVLTSAAEGSPMVVKEAMACNLPVVSVPVGDVRDVIGGTPGCALTAHDPVDIAAKLVGVLREPRRTDGRDRIDHLRDERIVERLLEVYRNARGPRRRGMPRFRRYAAG